MQNINEKYIILFILIVLLITLTGCKDKVCFYDLVAIKNSSSISGSFFLGSGTIENQQYFFAYVKFDNGGIVLWKCDRYSTTLFEDLKNNEVPYVALIEDWTGSQSFQFHIPKDSIMQNFNLN